MSPPRWGADPLLTPIWGGGDIGGLTPIWGETPLHFFACLILLSHLAIVKSRNSKNETPASHTSPLVFRHRNGIPSSRNSIFGWEDLSYCVLFVFTHCLFLRNGPTQQVISLVPYRDQTYRALIKELQEVRICSLFYPQLLKLIGCLVRG